VTAVAVIDDHPVYRAGLSTAVVDAGHELVGQYDSVESYLAAAVSSEVVLLDYHLPGLHGPEAVERITAKGDAVLMVSADVGRDAVLATIAAGARGYVPKYAEVAEILAAIDAVSSGTDGSYVSPRLASYLLDAYHKPGSTRVELTAREFEVLSLVAAGERDRDIAESLYISVGTVRAHLDHIRTKTGQRRRADLTRYALEHGVQPPASEES